MKINEITQQIIEGNRKTVENYINKIIALQNQAEGFAEEAIEKADLVPEKGRKTLQGLLRLGREYREEVAVQVERGCIEFEKLFPKVH